FSYDPNSFFLAGFRPPPLPIWGKSGAPLFLRLCKPLNLLVGAGRFELPTPCSRSKCPRLTSRRAVILSALRRDVRAPSAGKIWAEADLKSFQEAALSIQAQFTKKLAEQ